MNHDSSRSATQPTTAETDAISRRAYEIWETEGRPEGCELRHWAQAEKELARSSPESYPAAPRRSPAPRPSPDSDVTPLQGTRAAAAAAASSNRAASRREGVAAAMPPVRNGNAARKRVPGTPPL